MKIDRQGYAWLGASAAIAAGAVGVIMVIAGVHSPFSAPLALLFLALAPAAVVMPLLSRFDPLARLIIAGVTAVAVNFLVAETMLAAGVWSPRGIATVVTILTAVCAVARSLPARLRARSRR